MKLSGPHKQINNRTNTDITHKWIQIICIYERKYEHENWNSWIIKYNLTDQLKYRSNKSNKLKKFKFGFLKYSVIKYSIYG